MDNVTIGEHSEKWCRNVGYITWSFSRVLRLQLKPGCSFFLQTCQCAVILGLDFWSSAISVSVLDTASTALCFPKTWFI